MKTKNPGDSPGFFVAVLYRNQGLFLVVPRRIILPSDGTVSLPKSVKIHAHPVVATLYGKHNFTMT
jgi:hypothetical protein